MQPGVSKTQPLATIFYASGVRYNVLISSDVDFSVYQIDGEAGERFPEIRDWQLDVLVNRSFQESSTVCRTEAFLHESFERGR